MKGASQLPDRARPRILVTREADKAAETARLIEARGWSVILFPTVETRAPRDLALLDGAVEGIAEVDWVVFLSRTAVEVVARRASDLTVALSSRGHPRYAAVGEGTARALHDLGVREVLFPEPGCQDAEGLAATLCRIGVAGASVLVFRAEGGREVLATALREAGAVVSEVMAYRTVPREVTEAEVQSLLEGPSPDAALFMSPSAFRAFLSILGEGQARDFLRHAVLCAIGLTTARAMSAAGFPPNTVPSTPSVGAALDAIARITTRE